MYATFLPERILDMSVGKRRKKTYRVPALTYKMGFAFSGSSV